MMIKHTLSLSIDNSDDDWICVHTPIPDYQMAYHINKVFSVRLQRRPKDYASQKSNERFPIFSYQRRKEGVHWHLIRNKVETSSVVDSESLLFSSSETHYLFKQLKGVDYLLSVGTKVSESVQKKLAELPDVQSCYSLPKQVSHLKQQLSF
ncbi:MAG: IPExxxVDY family protein [Flavobacteriaceae bacterium]